MTVLIVSIDMNAYEFSLKCDVFLRLQEKLRNDHPGESCPLLPAARFKHMASYHLSSAWSHGRLMPPSQAAENCSTWEAAEQQARCCID